MAQEKIFANFDADDAPTDAEAFVSSGQMVNVGGDGAIRLALVDGEHQLGLSAHLSVRPNEMEFTRVGPVLAWTLVRGETAGHHDKMSITCDDHVNGKATLYLKRDGHKLLPIARLVSFDQNSGLHVVELSTFASPVEADPAVSRLVAAA